VYLTKYASPDNKIFEQDDDKIFKEFIAYLKKIFPNLSNDEIKEYWVFKDRFSQPIFVKNYSKIMPDITTPIKNLYLLNTAQIYPQSRSVNSSIALARNAVKEIICNNAD
jgi:protoporphyrinogen oxidase